MTDNITLDAAIEAAEIALMAVIDSQSISTREKERVHARALIAKLLEGMEKPDWFGVDEDCGWDAALAEIRRRAGIEGEK